MINRAFNQPGHFSLPKSDAKHFGAKGGNARANTLVAVYMIEGESVTTTEIAARRATGGEHDAEEDQGGPAPARACDVECDPGGREVMGKASELRAWLRDRPGWHFTGDILDGLGLIGWRERQPYADSLRSSSEHGFLDRSGTRTAIRYRYVREPAR